MSMMEDDRQVTFEITELIGVLTQHSTGWQKELNLVSWNGGAPKYDIRDWDPDHEHMSRGVTLHEKEMRLMFDLLRKRRAPRNHMKKQEPVKESEEAEVTATLAASEAQEVSEVMETIAEAAEERA